MAHEWQVKVERRWTCGADVVGLALSRPPEFDYVAGQWFRLSLDTDDGRQTKTFSMASAPSDPTIEMATRLSVSSFKRALADIAEGDTVIIAGPGGRLGANIGERAAFLAGGVGITPVRSMLRAAQAAGGRLEGVLFYGNRDESCVPFREDLEATAEAVGMRVVHVLERASVDWAGEVGFITAEMVRNHDHVEDGRPVVVSGPPVMVAAMERVLDELGVDPAVRRVERFGAVGTPVG